MASPLGKGLESLITKKDDAPEEPAALDILHTQASLHEPVYRFHDGGLSPHLAAVEPEGGIVATVAASPKPELISRPRRTESVFWIDIEKIEPNPHQPRRDFDEEQLAALAESIRERGMLQPLLVTKREIDAPSGLDVRYQLIVGERRLRAAKLAGLREVPVIIRTAETPEREKLELALIANVQREDLNPL
ncbi:MAG: ParB/RepB/Spo0J family partition protein, partial [Patescibacteria group bacterium]